MTLYTAATLSNIEEAGQSILILSEWLEREELLRSRLTRGEITRLLTLLAESLEGLPDTLHQAMPELDRAAWHRTLRQLHDSAGADDALCFAVQSLLPATLMWLRTYRHHQPELFSFSA